jgi:hypothetical protein
MRQLGTATITGERKVNFDSAVTDSATAKKVRRQKYGNKKCVVDGITFDSIREANHYKLLKLRESVGSISDLNLQVRFPLIVNSILIAAYVCDFVYVENGRRVVVDVKGIKTRIYSVKRKLMMAVHGIEVQEVF